MWTKTLVPANYFPSFRLVSSAYAKNRVHTVRGTECFMVEHVTLQWISCFYLRKTIFSAKRALSRESTETSILILSIMIFCFRSLKVSCWKVALDIHPRLLIIIVCGQDSAIERSLAPQIGHLNLVPVYLIRWHSRSQYRPETEFHYGGSTCKNPDDRT